MPVHPLTKRVWYSDPVAAGDRPVLGIAAGERASLLIDGGNSPAHVWELLSAAKALPIPPLSSIALTHWAVGAYVTQTFWQGNQAKELQK